MVWVYADKLGDDLMAAKRASKKNGRTSQIVNFDLDEHTYQIDPGRKKVYRRFVEIETAKASEILSTWRSQGLGV